PLVAHARGDGGEADAGDRRQGRVFLRRERGERGGGGHGSVPSSVDETGAGQPPAPGKGVDQFFGLPSSAGAGAPAGGAAAASGATGLPSASKYWILAA